MGENKMNECYIQHLHATDVGPFDTLDISFNRRFNFIIGPNSSGKTSILKCLALAVYPSRFYEFRYGDNVVVSCDAVYNDRTLRIGFVAPVVQNANVYRQARLDSYYHAPEENGATAIFLYGSDSINISPLFLGAYRRIGYKKIAGMTQEKSISESRGYYQSNGMENVVGGNTPDVKQWMINRYFMLEKDWAAPYKKNWDWIMGHLAVLSPANCKIEFREIKRDLEPIFAIQGKECYLEEVSAGFQAVLSLVFAVTEWIESTRGEEDCYIPEAVGTVVIDELDAHLHPEWQLTIRESLSTIFPKLQFITTTHSPHLIATAQSGELIVLPELNGTVQAKPTEKTYSGWNTDQILEEVMNVKSLENKEYTSRINQAMECMSKKDIQGMKSAIEQLKEVSHPSDTIVSVLEIRLAKLELEAADDPN